jgi:small GTP-binding protein
VERRSGARLTVRDCALRQNAGKTTLLERLSGAGSRFETVPTIGLNVKLVQRDGITFKVWDLGGASQYRGEWARYTQTVDVLIFVVDSSDRANVETSKMELHRLLEAREHATTVRARWRRAGAEYGR